MQDGGRPYLRVSPRASSSPTPCVSPTSAVYMPWEKGEGMKHPVRKEKYQLCLKYEGVVHVPESRMAMVIMLTMLTNMMRTMAMMMENDNENDNGKVDDINTKHQTENERIIPKMKAKRITAMPMRTALRRIT